MYSAGLLKFAILVNCFVLSFTFSQGGVTYPVYSGSTAAPLYMPRRPPIQRTPPTALHLIDPFLADADLSSFHAEREFQKSLKFINNQFITRYYAKGEQNLSIEESEDLMRAMKIVLDAWHELGISIKGTPEYKDQIFWKYEMARSESKLGLHYLEDDAAIAYGKILYKYDDYDSDSESDY